MPCLYNVVNVVNAVNVYITDLAQTWAHLSLNRCLWLLLRQPSPKKGGLVTKPKRYLITVVATALSSSAGFFVGAIIIGSPSALKV